MQAGRGRMASMQWASPKEAYLGPPWMPRELHKTLRTHGGQKAASPLPSLWLSFLVQNGGGHELEERAKRVSILIQWKDGGDSEDLCPRNPIASHNLETISIHLAITLTKAKPRGTCPYRNYLNFTIK